MLKKDRERVRRRFEKRQRARHSPKVFWIFKVKFSWVLHEVQPHKMMFLKVRAQQRFTTNEFAKQMVPWVGRAAAT